MRSHLARLALAGSLITGLACLSDAAVGTPQVNAEVTPALSIAGAGQVIARFSNPRGVYVAPNGRVFVAVYGNGDVYEVLNGSTLTRIASNIPGAHSMAMAANGDLLVTQWGGHLMILHPDGSTASGPDLPVGAGGIVVAPDGSVYTSGAYEGIRHWTSDFSRYDLIYSGDSGYMALLPDGRIAFNNWFDSNTRILDSHGGTVSIPNRAGLAQGLVADAAGRLYLADSTAATIRTIDQAGNVAAFLATPEGAWQLSIDMRGWLYVMGVNGVLMRYPFSALPSAPENISGTGADGAAHVHWSAPTFAGYPSTMEYSATASPGGATCTTSSLSCTVTGLKNRQRYTFTVTVTNSAGESTPSEQSSSVMPLAAGFQSWPVDNVLSVGASTTVNIAQAAAGASIAVTGATKASLTADSAGFASASFVATKAGVQKFTATYSVKVGKKTTKNTTTAQLYVPSVSGPMLKIKTGKTGKFSLQFMPPGAAVSIALTDGQTISGIADAAGKASFTPTFTTKGAVNYSVTVAGVQIATGGLTVI